MNNLAQIECLMKFNKTKKEKISITDLPFSIWICKTYLDKSFSIQLTLIQAIINQLKILLWDKIIPMIIIRASIRMTHRFSRLRSIRHFSLNLWVPPWLMKIARLKAVSDMRNIIINMLIKIRACTTPQVRVCYPQAPSSKQFHLSKLYAEMQVYLTHRVECLSQSTPILWKERNSRVCWIRKCRYHPLQGIR